MTTYVRWPCIYYSRLPNRRGVRKVHAGWFTKLERGRAVRIARKLTERDRQYLLGRLPPNYPVPALPSFVAWSYSERMKITFLRCYYGRTMQQYMANSVRMIVCKPRCF